MTNPSFELILPLDRQLKNGSYPLCLRTTIGRSPRTLTLNEKLTKIEFANIWEAPSPRGFNLTRKQQFQNDYIHKANMILKEMNDEGLIKFDYIEFSARFRGVKPSIKQNLLTMYDKMIDQCNAEGRIKTGKVYLNSKQNIMAFFPIKNGEIRFDSIKSSDLNAFKSYVLNDKNGSITSVSIWLRHLRAVYNYAIKEKIIAKEVTPFNDGNNFKMPKSTNPKKALNFDDIEKLLKYTYIDGSIRIKAKDFWVLSFYCYGMNMGDILRLKNENLTDESITFIRKKTSLTSIKNLKPVVVPLNNIILNIINKYRKNSSNKSDYIFEVLHELDGEVEIIRKIENFIKFLNDQIKIIANSLGIDKSISSIFARHSFATLANNKELPRERISTSLGHSQLSTTDNYIDSLPLEKVKKFHEDVYGSFNKDN